MAISVRTFLNINRFVSSLPLAKQIRRLSVPRSGHNGVEVAGMTFRNRLGLSSGIDRNADYLNTLQDFGFGHICIGPLSAHTGDGRSISADKGIRYAISKLQGIKKECNLAFSIGYEGPESDDEHVIKDFLTTFSLGYDFADFFVLDFCSDILKSIIDPQFIEAVTDPILETRLSYDRYKPIFLRIPQAASLQMLDSVCDYCRYSGVDGMILSGEEHISHVHSRTDGHLPIIGTGRICSPADASRLLQCGADIIEIGEEITRKGGRLTKKILKSI